MIEGKVISGDGHLDLSAYDPVAVARQLYRAAEMGSGGGELNVNSAHQPIYHRDWDVLWAAAPETNLPVSSHTAGLSTTIWGIWMNASSKNKCARTPPSCTGSHTSDDWKVVTSSISVQVPQSDASVGRDIERYRDLEIHFIVATNRLDGHH